MKEAAYVEEHEDGWVTITVMGDPQHAMPDEKKVHLSPAEAKSLNGYLTDLYKKESA